MKNVFLIGSATSAKAPTKSGAWGFRASFSAVVLVVSIFLVGCDGEVEMPRLPIISISIGEHVAVVEVAVTPEQKRIGLMNRSELLPNHGMLFVFEREDYLRFWMKDTYVPLSIAFIDARGRIFQIEDMEPLNEDVHASRARALYALEMEQGWFRERGIEPGAVVEFPPELETLIRHYRRR